MNKKSQYFMTLYSFDEYEFLMNL